MAGPNVDGAHSSSGVKPFWMQQQDNTPKETETDKLKKGNVWDYAASMQAGAFQG